MFFLFLRNYYLLIFDICLHTKLGFESSSSRPTPVILMYFVDLSFLEYLFIGNE